MFRRFAVFAGLSLVVLTTGFVALAAENAQQGFTTPETAAADPDFALQGEYTGKEVALQVVAQGNGKFLVVAYRGGLPGAGWNGTQKQDAEEDAAEVRKQIADLELKKVDRKSPTLGAKPPQGAVVLFDGTEATFKQHWRDGAKLGDGLLNQGATSTDNFRDFTIHLEFRLPYMPLARGQGRGNSGLYYQGRFETQVLDSFGLEGKDNECGGIYSIKNPDVNMCLPPLVWQTYDAEFTAARYDAAGKKTANARVTVRHNGVLIHEDVELPRITTAAPNQESSEPGPIYLQDHGNPVRYRNIWVLPRNAEKEARRPAIPQFERFFASTASDNVAGGRLLISELNCAACHEPTPKLTGVPRPAPILDEVGQRVHPEWLVSYLTDPHATKPGTVMPDLLRNLPEAERQSTALALAHFLASTGTLAQRGSDPQSAERGKNLFHQIGCVACHAPRVGETVPDKSSIPLGDLDKKYSITSLATFLENPQHARPAGRMPRLVQNPQEATDLANYLVGAVEVQPKNPNLRFTAYHGSWDKVPDFSEIKPVKSGQSAGFDMGLAGRGNNFGLRFEGFLKIEKAGEYTFHLGSDDGSLLFIDGAKVADSDGIHPHTVHSGKKKLDVGMHKLRVDFSQVGGEASLTLEFEGPGLARQDANRSIFLTEQGPPPKSADEESKEFKLQPALVAKGRELFQSVGCANCHQLKLDGKAVEPVVKGPAFVESRMGQGCLAAVSANGTKSKSPVPAYDLNMTQRSAISAALADEIAPVPMANTAPKPDAFDPKIERAMLAFNCYACHARGGVGGPDRAHNPLFRTSIQEMGDEGRVPPPLDGVGDKLNDDWLRHVLNEGAKDRPYMLTRMPRFGVEAVSQLADVFIRQDRKPASPAVPLPEAEIRAKAVGRHLVGDKALGCIKCHTFGPHQTPGIRAIELQTMTRRVREDWFHRYMVDPPAYRPGTRMPTGFPEGKATIRDVYEGAPSKQLAAIWSYLKDGDRAGLPEGLIGNVIELKPDGRPVLYRNFIEGLSPRGIGVGYPEKVNVAWDANKVCLTLLWHGRFIDAGKHWEGRGPGFQGPLGDHVIRLEETVPFALLRDEKEAWPTSSPRELGWRFKSYQLDAAGRPHFHYANEIVKVEDFPEPVAGGRDAAIKRRLTLKSESPNGKVWFRAAVGKIELLPTGEYLVNDVYRIRVPGQPIVRESAGKQELLLPVIIKDGTAEIVQEIAW